MKIHPQIILKNKTPVFAILPYEEYESILEKLEDLADIEIIQAAQSDKSERFPLWLIESIATGKNAIKAYREYRELSQNALAEKAKISKQYVSQLENNERKGTLAVLRKIAKVLNIELEDII